MTDDPAAAVGTGRRELVYCAFERIERVSSSRHCHGERLVIAVSADFALCHRVLEDPMF